MLRLMSGLPPFAGIGAAWMAAAARELFARVEVIAGAGVTALADRGPFDPLFADGGRPGGVESSAGCG